MCTPHREDRCCCSSVRVRRPTGTQTGRKGKRSAFWSASKFSRRATPCRATPCRDVPCHATSMYENGPVLGGTTACTLHTPYHAIGHTHTHRVTQRQRPRTRALAHRQKSETHPHLHSCERAFSYFHSIFTHSLKHFHTMTIHFSFNVLLRFFHSISGHGFRIIGVRSVFHSMFPSVPDSMLHSNVSIQCFIYAFHSFIH